MTTPVLTKQVTESRMFDVDFSALLASGETITAIAAGPTIAVNTDPVLVLSESTISVSGKFIQFRAAAGTNAGYKITIRVTTSAGNTLEGEVMLKVYDK